MARYEAVGEPVNDSERRVLETLRNELPKDWYVLGNFEIFDGRRSFEADAVVVSPHGWAYVIEVKQLDVIEGNSATWMVRSRRGSNLIPFDSPYGITRHKAKKLAGMIRSAAPASVPFVEPLIVIVSEIEPRLTGAVAAVTCRYVDVVARAATDPRTKATENTEYDAAIVFEALMRDARPLTPANQLGGFELDEIVDVGPSWRTWLAHSVMNPDEPLRLKYYEIDPLVPEEAKERIVTRALRDSKTLFALQGEPGVAWIVSMPQEVEGGVIVATKWPPGQSLASHLQRGLDADRAIRIYERLVAIVAGLHDKDVVHRNLSPRSVYLGSGDSVTVTDFDFARIEGSSGVTSLIRKDELDPNFVAPEVIGDPAATTKASDVWSLGRIGHGLMAGAAEVPTTIQSTIDAATRTEPSERPSDAAALLKILEKTPPPPTVLQLQARDVIDERFVIEEVFLEGGHSIVYRATDTRTDQILALKFAKPSSGINLAAEIQSTRSLLGQVGLAVPTALVQCSRVRRATEYPFRQEFLTLQWVDGEPLSAYLDAGMSLAECLRIGESLANAVGVLHEHGVVHRDIKPENVILDRNSRPWVIDFNVSVSTADSDWSVAGTPWYQPPDVALNSVNPDVDVYALTGTLLELIVGERLQGRFTERLEQDERLPDAVTQMLRRGLAPRPQRPSNCSKLAAMIAMARSSLVERPLPGRTAPATKRKNTNPTVFELVKRFSQSSISNSGTRGLADFDANTYVETKLDGDLVHRLIEAGPRLILITGNAGDGKTAFLQKVERRLREMNPKSEELLENGALISTDKIDFRSNWDGSQDEVGRSNDDVIIEFLEPFEGADPDPGSRVVRLIAINEGRLLDFVKTHRERFPRLAGLVEAVLVYGKPVAAEWFEIVNLNLRTLTASEGPSPSIVERTLAAFADGSLWTACESCDFRKRCPIRWNAASIGDPSRGTQIANRIQQVLDVVRLRRQLHVTMRDLRSLLSFLIAGNTTCDEIAGHVIAERDRSLLNLAFYNNLFAASFLDTAHPKAESARRDRFLDAVGDLDVARFSNPVDDARLWLESSNANEREAEANDEEVATDFSSVLSGLASEVRFSGGNDEDLGDIRLLHASLRRQALLVSTNPDWEVMLPFSHLRALRRQLSGSENIHPRELLDAVSRSEGFPTTRFSGQVGVQTGSGTVGRAATFVAHPHEDFSLIVDDRSHLARYVEYVPSSLLLSHTRDPDTRLTVDLEKYEMLKQVADGNSPSHEQRQGQWIELNVFKDKLRRLPAEATILIDDSGRVLRITRRLDIVGIQVDEVR